MFKNVACGLVLALSLSYGAAYAEDGPTLDQVYKAAQSGHLDEAQKMMGTVLSAHPNSAKAHFVEAELLSKQGQLSQAENELATAERLKPGLPFANAQSVQDLKSRISASHHVSQPNPSSVSNYQTQPANSFPWGMLLLGVAACTVIFLIMRAKTARSQSVYQGNYPQAAAPMNPYGGGMGPTGGGMGQGGMAPMGGGMGGGGMGSGIMGGLATGAAVGVGMVAGEALEHHFLDGGHSAAPQADSWNSSSNNMAPNNMGGSDFGIADTGSWDDSSNIASSDDSGGDWG